MDGFTDINTQATGDDSSFLEFGDTQGSQYDYSEFTGNTQTSIASSSTLKKDTSRSSVNKDPSAKVKKSNANKNEDLPSQFASLSLSSQLTTDVVSSQLDTATSSLSKKLEQLNFGGLDDDEDEDYEASGMQFGEDGEFGHLTELPPHACTYVIRYILFLFLN